METSTFHSHLSCGVSNVINAHIKLLFMCGGREAAVGGRGAGAGGQGAEGGARGAGGGGCEAVGEGWGAGQ